MAVETAGLNTVPSIQRVLPKYAYKGGAMRRTVFIIALVVMLCGLQGCDSQIFIDKKPIVGKWERYSFSVTITDKTLTEYKSGTAFTAGYRVVDHGPKFYVLEWAAMDKTAMVRIDILSKTEIQYGSWVLSRSPVKK